MQIVAKQDLIFQCQILFAGEKCEKNISKCCLLKKIPRVLHINVLAFSVYLYNENPSFFKMSFLTLYKYELIILPCLIVRMRHIARFTCLRVLMGCGLEVGGWGEDDSEIL